MKPRNWVVLGLALFSLTGGTLTVLTMLSVGTWLREVEFNNWCPLIVLACDGLWAAVGIMFYASLGSESSPGPEQEKTAGSDIRTAGTTREIPK